MSENESNFFEWKVGIQNPAEKFLSVEVYGNKVNASGHSLRQKQTWTIEFHTEDLVYIRSYLKTYLSTDKLGNVTCAANERGESERFSIEYPSDGSAQWAFKSQKFKYYLGGTDDGLQCNSLAASEVDLSLWYTPFVMHPQVTLYNVCRKRYAILDGDQVKLSADKAWGREALFTIEFYCGRYRLKTSDNRYLSNDGSLVNTHDKDTLYAMELHFDPEQKLRGLSFKDYEGKYLSGIGMAGNLKAHNRRVQKDQLFVIEESQPQVVIFGNLGKIATVKFEQEIMMTNKEVSKDEIFQMEYDSKKKKWVIGTSLNKMWRLAKNGTIRAESTHISENNHFDIEWLANGLSSIKCCNGKFVASVGTGNMVANSPSPSEAEHFKIRIQNRPLIVFRSDVGYIGQKVMGSNKSEYVCNKSQPSIMLLEPLDDGRYSVKGENGKYWCLESDPGARPTIKANSGTPVPFVLEFRDTSLLSILAPNGKFMVCDKVGLFHADGEKVERNCLLYY